jgi:hypothetical protein
MVRGQFHTTTALPLGKKSPDTFHREECVGYRTSRKVKKKIFLLPEVEIQFLVNSPSNVVTVQTELWTLPEYP